MQLCGRAFCQDQGCSRTVSGQQVLQALDLLSSSGLQMLLHIQKRRREKAVMTKQHPLPFLPECLPRANLVSSLKGCLMLNFKQALQVQASCTPPQV